MSTTLYCPRCRQNVQATVWDTPSIIILAVLLLLGIVLGLIYLVYKLTREEKCPNCKCPASMMEPPRYGNQQSGPSASSAGGCSPGTVYCPKCGAAVGSSAKFCASCGAKFQP